jgi:hypothetical protein
MGYVICKEYARFLSSRELKLCYSTHTISEINRGIPEGVTQKARIIDFEAAKGKHLEEKNRRAQWLQERGQHPVKPVESNTPTLPQAFIERDQKPHPDKQRKFNPVETHTGQIQPPAEIKNNVIDFQTAREKRRLGEQVVAEPAEIPQYKTDKIDSTKDEEQRDNDKDNGFDEETRDKEQMIAMGVIGTKLAQFDVPMQKRDEIFESLVDDPNAIVKVAGVVRNFHPQNSIEILENIAAFRKRIDQAVENKAGQANEGTEKELSGFELLLLILGSLLKGSAEAIAGEELEQIGLKEKEEKSE